MPRVEGLGCVVRGSRLRGLGLGLVGGKGFSSGRRVEGKG